MGRERRPVQQDEQATPAQSPVLLRRPQDTGLEAGGLGPRPPDSPGREGLATVRASPTPPRPRPPVRLPTYLGQGKTTQIQSNVADTAGDPSTEIQGWLPAKVTQVDTQVSGPTLLLRTWGGRLTAFLLTKHTEGVTLENIFEKYFIWNALQKHRGHAHRCLTMCVLVVII